MSLYALLSLFSRLITSSKDLVSFAMMLLITIRQIKLGIAISPLNISDMFQATCKPESEPKNTTAQNTSLYIMFSLGVPVIYSKLFSP